MDLICTARLFIRRSKSVDRPRYGEVVMGAGPIIIPLVALLIPILLLLMAVVFDAVFVSWAAYRLWHDREHGFLKRLIHHDPS